MLRFSIILLFLISNISLAQDKDQSKTNNILSIKAKSFGYRYISNGNEINKSDFEQELMKKPEAFNMYKKGKSQSQLSNIIGIPAGLVFGWNIGYWAASGEKPNMTVFATSGVLWGSAIVLGAMSKSNINKSLDMYHNKNQTVSLNLNINSYGVGVAARF